MPDVSLDQIAQLESGNRNVANYRYDPRHTAGGYWQITDTTWRDIAPRAGIDIAAYPTAMSAPYEVQRQAAATLKAQRGLSPWAPYNPRIAQAAGGGAQSFEEAAQGTPIKIEKGVQPPAPDFALLDTLLGGQPQGEPEDEGNALLSILLQGGQGSPQASATAPAASEASQELPPIQRPPQRFAEAGTEPLVQPQPVAGGMPSAQPTSGNGLLDSLLATINPIGSAHAAELPTAAKPAFPPKPATPSTGSSTAPIVEPGQQAPAEPGSAVGKVGEALASDAYTLLDTLLLNPIRQGAAGVEGALTGKGFTADQAMAGASVGFTGSMGRGGLGAGPRLPKGRIEPELPKGLPEPSAGVVALRAPDGSLIVGKPGEIHADLLDRYDAAHPTGTAEPGWMGPDNVFKGEFSPPPAALGRTPAEPPVVTAGPSGAPAARPADRGAFKAGLAQAAKSIEKALSPTTVDAAAGQAEAVFRYETGQARRASTKAEAQVSARGPGANPPAASFRERIKEPWRPLVNAHVPEFEAYLAAKKAGQSPPEPALLKFIDFVETRSKGTQYQGPPELRPLADVLRNIYRERALAIAAEPSANWGGFIDDYYMHLWKEGERPGSHIGAPARQGSGRNLKQRTIPTVSEGIAAGLTPVTLDPIEMSMRYVTNMDRYLAHNRIFRLGREGGSIKFHQPGQEPEGWAPLTGRLAERAVATGGEPAALGLTAYAPEGFARVYNNAVRSGFFESELGGNVYSAVLKTKNAITQAVLSLSGYHAVAMSQEAMASALASGIRDLSQGEIKTALKQLGLGAMPFAKAGKDVLTTGRKMERQYAGIEDYGPDWERITNLYAGGGGQAKGRGLEWQGTSAENYLTSFRRGAMRLDWKAGRDRIHEGNPIFDTFRAAGFAARELARINETLTSPLFDVMIPRLKKAAFYDEMSGWLKANPAATMEQQLAQSRRLLDTIDDRFGEMMMDNIFWGRRAKQTLQIAATSVGWELGSLRSIGGSAFDAARREFSAPRVRYVIGLGGAIAIMNGAYQYLKTGKTPGEDIGGALSKGGALDLIVPRTGGTTPEGNYERALPPGFEKDILGYWHDPLGELAGKLSPFGRLTTEMFTGKDYFGRDIAPFPKYTPEWFKAYAGHVLEGFTPIPFKQERYRGTNIGTVERFMGNRAAPEYLQNPQRVADSELKHRLGDLRARFRGLYAHGARTYEEQKSLDKQAKAITEEIDELIRSSDAATKGRKPSQHLYRPAPRKPLEYSIKPGGQPLEYPWLPTPR